MKGGEGEGAHRATFFCLLTGIIGGNSEGLRGEFPLTGLDKTLLYILCKTEQTKNKAVGNVVTIYSMLEHLLYFSRPIITEPKQIQPTVRCCLYIEHDRKKLYRAIFMPRFLRHMLFATLRL
jgi:hypothetical protein